MTLPESVHRTWQSVELLIAFHKNKRQQRRDTPFLWRPKDAMARLLAKPDDQEAFVNLKSEGDSEDVQIKFHPEKIVIRRDQVLGWSGMIIDDDFVRVKVDNIWVLIKPDGSITVENDAETTYLEGDGSIIKITPESEIMVSGDGSRISRRTEHQIDAFTNDGFVSKKQQQRPADELENNDNNDA